MPETKSAPALAGTKAKDVVKGMIDAKFFYQRIKDVKLFDKLTPLQVITIDSLLNEWQKQGDGDVKKLSYILATCYHEAFNPSKPESRLTPIKEFGSDKYLKSKKYWPYIGLGLVQITWLENYKKFSKILGIDLVNHPELALNPDIAAKIAVYGMIHGTFTGKKLSDYFNSKTEDPVNARKIINGIDKAQTIAGHYRKFNQCLKLIGGQ